MSYLRRGSIFSTSAPITIGEDDTGYDVKLFGATSGKYWMWDESANEVVIAGKQRVLKGSPYQTSTHAAWALSTN